MSSVLEAVCVRAGREPRAGALRSADETLSFAELLTQTRIIGQQLRRRKVGVLGVAADNGPDWVAVDLAAQLVGIALVPIPPFFTAKQSCHALADSGADSVIVDGPGAGQLRGLLSDRGVAVTTGLTLHAMDKPIGAGKLPPGTAKVSYTSGTTGTPKGVCLSQALMDRVAASLNAATADLDIERHMCALPLAVLLENIGGIYAPMLAGAEVVIPGLRDIGFDGAARLDIVKLVGELARQQAQSVILLPQMLAAFIEAIDNGLVSIPPSLRFVAVGGGRVATSLLERADLLELPVFEGYGLTECASVVALNTPQARRCGSVGRPLEHVEIEFGPGSELLVRGAAMLGYTGSPDPVSPAQPTGDIGHVDTDGFLYIDGRRKNAFITSFGRNVSPEWVEAELGGQPAISQAVLFGEARPWNVAVIVPAGRGFDAASLQSSIDAVNATLPDYAKVGQWILATEAFTTANGLLTANGRNRRQAIWKRYAEAVDRVYGDAQARSA